MSVESIIFYLTERYKEEQIKSARENYSTDIQVSILRMLRRDNKVKTWSEINNKINGTTKQDNRTAKQIEEDTLNLFKKYTIER